MPLAKGAPPPDVEAKAKENAGEDSSGRDGREGEERGFFL